LNIDWRAVRTWTAANDERAGLRMAPGHRIVAELSGGNIQRVVLTRALGTQATIVVAAYPSRGLDIATTRRTQELLLEQRDGGAGGRGGWAGPRGPRAGWWGPAPGPWGCPRAGPGGGGAPPRPTATPSASSCSAVRGEARSGAMKRGVGWVVAVLAAPVVFGG